MKIQTYLLDTSKLKLPIIGATLIISEKGVKAEVIHDHGKKKIVRLKLIKDKK